MDTIERKEYSEHEITDLCQKIRDELIGQLSKSGGYLADQLAAVDVVVSLNRIFGNYADLLFSGDRITFAQNYLKKNGLTDSCFENVTMAQAMGIACAHKYQKDDIPVVYVTTDEDIIDFNIIKQLDAADLKMTIIYLDRQDKDVNALNKLVNDLRQTDAYTGLKKGIKKSLRSIKSSEQIISSIHKFKDNLKKTIIDEDIFSRCNVDYLGPIDGHDLKQLKKAFLNVRKNRRLVVLHCLVKKGKGYRFAETEDAFNGYVTPFNQKDGRIFAAENEKNLKQSTIINKTLAKMILNDKNIFWVANESLQANGMSDVFAESPERCLQTKLNEEEYLKLLQGLMERGLKPVASITSEMLTRYQTQLNELATLNRALILYTNENDDLSYNDLKQLKDLYVIYPMDGNELQKVLYTAIEISKPVIIINGRQCLAYEEIDKESLDDLGKWHFIVNNEVGDTVIISKGTDLLKLRDIIVSNELGYSLLDISCLNRCDEECIRDLKKRYKYFYFYGTDDLIKEYLPGIVIIDGTIDTLFARIKKDLDA